MPGRRSNPNVMRRPRVPLPRQRGGAHENKTRRPFRRRKHKKDGGGLGGVKSLCGRYSCSWW